MTKQVYPIALLVLVVATGCGSSGGDAGVSAPSGTGGAGGMGTTATDTTATGGTPQATTTMSAASSSSSAGTSSATSSGAGPTDGGMNDAPPPMIEPCTGTMTVGVWENISPPAFVTPSNLETIVVGVNPLDGSVFAAAGNVTNGGQPPLGTGIYKSSDCGATFSLVSTGKSSANLASGDVWSFRIDPDNPQTMYAANGYGNNPTLYKTTNGGVDWDPLSPDVDNALSEHNNFVEAVAIDPANSQHLAITFHDSCTTKYNSLCMSQTGDGGATWHEFSGPSQISGWQEAASITIVAATGYVYTSPQGTWYTGDTGQTWKQVLPQGSMAYYGDSGVLGPDGTLYLGLGGTGIFASQATPSTPLGSTWKLLPNSPGGSALISAGDTLFSSYAWDTSGQPFYTAPFSDLTKWNHNASPTVGRGSSMVAYDSARHVFYSANLGAGLWRMKTE